MLVFLCASWLLFCQTGQYFQGTFLWHVRILCYSRNSFVFLCGSILLPYIEARFQYCF